MSSPVFSRLRVIPAALAAVVVLTTIGAAPVAAATDSDGDGLRNTWERYYSRTSPYRKDTDRDGTPDGREDPDRDRLTNRQELLSRTHPLRWDTDKDGKRDDFENLDGDALYNWFEFRAKTSVRRGDTDRDGLGDGKEDPDKDGLRNRAEQTHKTHPRKADTDGDGYSDGLEVKAGTNPLDPKRHPSSANTPPDPDPTPSPTPTPKPSATPTPKPSATASPTPAPTAKPTPTPTPKPTPAPTQITGAFHISTSGSDSDPGSAAAPWRTLQKAANTLTAGQTVVIHPGTYEGFSMSRSGASGDPITFSRAPGEARPVITGSRVDMIKLSALHDVVLDGLVVEGADGGGGSGAGIRIENGSYRVTVRNSIIRNNRSYGININNSTYVSVLDSEVAHNEEGIYVSRAGEGVRIEGNKVHHQDKLVVNSPDIAHDDHGAVGIAFVRTTGKVTVVDNDVWANRAPSYDYDWDGGAFEIYGASNVHIIGNRTWDNENVFETGTDGTLCANNVFRHNVSYGATSRGRSFGIFIRCGDDMVVANNSFHNLDQFVFSVGGQSRYNGSFDGLEIRNNIAVMASGKIIGIESALPSSVVIDHNLFEHTAGGQIATVTGKGGTNSMATFTSWTGFQSHGIDADPKWVNAANRDYRLASGSPAIDRGVVVFSGIAYAGAAPDLGRYETGLD